MSFRGSVIDLTPDVIVDRLLQRMGSDPERYGIQWMNDTEGYKAKVDGISFTLQYPVPTLSPLAVGVSKIYLTIEQDGKTLVIEEPAYHFSRTPLGKFLRFVTGLSRTFTASLGANPFPKELYPRGPRTLKEIEDEKVRIGLNKLYLRVEKQFRTRARKAR